MNRHRNRPRVPPIDWDNIYLGRQHVVGFYEKGGYTFRKLTKTGRRGRPYWSLWAGEVISIGRAQHGFWLRSEENGKLSLVLIKPEDTDLPLPLLGEKYINDPGLVLEDDVRGWVATSILSCMQHVFPLDDRTHKAQPPFWAAAFHKDYVMLESAKCAGSEFRPPTQPLPEHLELPQAILNR